MLDSEETSDAPWPTSVTRYHADYPFEAAGTLVGNHLTLMGPNVFDVQASWDDQNQVWKRVVLDPWRTFDAELAYGRYRPAPEESSLNTDFPPQDGAEVASTMTTLIAPAAANDAADDSDRSGD